MIPDDAARNLIRMDARIAAVRAIIGNGPLDADELHRRIRRTLGYAVSDADIRASLSSLRRDGVIRLVGMPGRRRIALARDDRVWEEDARRCLTSEVHTICRELDGQALSIHTLAWTTGIRVDRVQRALTHMTREGLVRILEGGDVPHYTLVRREA